VFPLLPHGFNKSLDEMSCSRGNSGNTFVVRIQGTIQRVIRQLSGSGVSRGNLFQTVLREGVSSQSFPNHTTPQLKIYPHTPLPQTQNRILKGHALFTIDLLSGGALWLGHYLVPPSSRPLLTHSLTNNGFW
jgi:hypothetical protein